MGFLDVRKLLLDEVCVGVVAHRVVECLIASREGVVLSEDDRGVERQRQIEPSRLTVYGGALWNVDKSNRGGVIIRPVDDRVFVCVGEGRDGTGGVGDVVFRQKFYFCQSGRR